jgi:hypothetical protein
VTARSYTKRAFNVDSNSGLLLGASSPFATFLNDLRAAGKNVFVHCRLGLNLSALLAGLMLIDEGYLVEDAIDLMRDLRSPRSSRTARSSATCSRWTGSVEPMRLHSSDRLAHAYTRNADACNAGGRGAVSGLRGLPARRAVAVAVPPSADPAGSLFALRACQRA